MSDTLPQTIGIDISKATLDAHAYPAGSNQQFANTSSGHKGLIAWLGQWSVERAAFRDIQAEADSCGAFEVLLQGTEANLTLGEVARRFATSDRCPQVAGTPESVTDHLQEVFENNGCDGFIVTPTVMPGSFEAFTRSVVPILQKRGVFRREYPGATLRDTIKA
ncbi:hypothetical protein ACDY96_19975 [Rhizobium mongolense]|uniref:hypothetical protein n=1 Tax=Rhizobium mongolense TaxID=57676 RepID=UPI0035586F36